MMYSIRKLALCVIAVSCVLFLSDGGGRPRFLSAALAQGASCTFPTSIPAGQSPEQTSWELFVAANCTASNGKLVWENWIEQDDLYPPASSGKGVKALAANGMHRLHASPLAMALVRGAPQLHLLALPNTGCGQMNANPLPPNVVAQPTICEEVHVNPDAAQFLTSNGYQFRQGQAAAAQKTVNIQFPASAIEVKVDWIPATSFQQQYSFNCTNPPPGVHVEMIDGVCYEMGGIHIISKLVSNWVWATFEPQNSVMNPWRCQRFGACSDSWGSVPGTSTGQSTERSSALQALESQSNMPQEFQNYRLDGVQLNFTNPDNSPTYLGNSVIEGENVGMTFNTASCVTCHSVSSIAKGGTDGLSFLAGGVPTVGQQFAVFPVQGGIPGWIGRDFVWSMNQACPNDFGRVSSCAPQNKSSAVPKPKAKTKK